MARRKSLARRTPIIVYRVEPNDESAIEMRAWVGDENGRMIKEQFVGNAKISEYDGPEVRGQWLDSTDTDGIHALPEEVRDGLFEFDDAIRKALG